MATKAAKKTKKTKKATKRAAKKPAKKVAKKPAKKTARKPSASWRGILGKALGWGEAHATLDAATNNLAHALQGTRPNGLPHSAWELLDHIRRTQADLLHFMTSRDYVAPEWPREYWPDSPTPPNARSWDDCLAQIARDRAALTKLAERSTLDLTSRIPWGDGQTYLRTLLLAFDHESYHVGEIVIVRRLLGAWPD